MQLVYETGEINHDIRPSGVVGTFTPEVALSRLLAHTSLEYRLVNARTVSIRSAEVDRLPSPAATAFQPAGNALVSSASTDTSTLAEVVVTAQKREERLEDVPVPISAIAADTLAEQNQVRLQDYYTSVPGLNVSPAVQSSQVISIRGITTGYGTNPTVGITVDDVPYGSSTGLGGGQVVPDIDPGDLARIEVLRGPQGTLYGASSLGGLIKFVTVDPSTAGWSGRVQAGTETVYNAAGLGYNLRGSVNVPMSDTLALRASAFTREDPGYIDDPVLGRDGVNEAHAYGGRLAALWKPLDNFSLKLSALYQQVRSNGSDDVDVVPGLGDLQQSYLPGVGGYDREVQAYSAIANAQFGSVNLTAVSGYNVNSYSDSFDYTSTLGECCTLPAFGVTGTVNIDQNRTSKFTQEIRLSTPFGSRFEGLLGGFYTHESSHYTQVTEAEDNTTGAIVPGSPDFFRFPTTYQEYAAFADLTTHITDQFDVQLGARESHISQSIVESEVGPYVSIFFGVPSPYLLPEVTSTANAFTYLVTPRWKISRDLMLYARLASGYRAGGPNAVPGVPTQYSPDKTENYEVGFKGDLLGRLLTVDASIYYVDWRDIQVNLSNALGVSYNANGGKAKSEGVELSIQSNPARGLTVGGWIDLDHAILTQDFPASSTAIALSGDRLPDGARLSGNLSIQQDFPISAAVSGFIGATASYVGDRWGTFPSIYAATSQRQYYPSYAKADVRGGAKYADWTFNLFVNNVTDRRAVLSGGIGDYPPFAFKVIQPRLIGLSVIRTF